MTAPYHPAPKPRPFPTQRDCARTACRALGIQCEERRSGMECKEVDANAPLTPWADLPMAGAS